MPSTTFGNLTRKSLQTPYALQTIILKDSGTLTAATAQDRIVMGAAGVIVDARAVVGTAPTGATAIFDINKNGTTIFTSQAARPTIPISGTATAAATTPAVTAFAAGDVITLDCDQTLR
jgi:hypothetical protein